MGPIYHCVMVALLLPLYNTGVCYGKLNVGIDEGNISRGRANQEISSYGEGESRLPKFFHLFGLIKLPNEVCSTSMGEGVCTLKSECKGKKGISLGTCAQGFGCCCSYTRQCSASDWEFTIRENRTVIKSDSNTTHPAICRFVFPKLRAVYQIRLDFVNFTFGNAGVTGACIDDSLTISGSTTLDNILTVCGNLTGQHMYLTYGESEKITLTFQTTSSRTSTPNYEIKISHIANNSPRRVPEYCLQSFDSRSGKVFSFNYDNQQLNTENYTVCIASDSGSRSINWSPCSKDSFTISGKREDPESRQSINFVEGPCQHDFVQAFGDNKKCGSTFTEVKELPKPFLLRVSFDDEETRALPKAFKAPAEDYHTCIAMSSENLLNCDWHPVNECMCNVIAPARGDEGNFGFCLEYSVNF